MEKQKWAWHNSREKRTIGLPLERPLYARHTEKYFKFYCPLLKHGIFVNIYAKNEDTPVVFKALIEKYMDDWLDELEAAIKAKDVVNDFFDICDTLSKKKVRPFKIKFTKININKVKKKPKKK